MLEYVYRKDKIYVGVQFIIVFIFLFIDVNYVKNISGKSKISLML